MKEKKYPVVKEAFNVTTQQLEDHEVTIDQNGDYVFTAGDGTFFKLPSSLAPEEIQGELVRYEEANKGQVSNKASEEKLKKLADL